MHIQGRYHLKWTQCYSCRVQFYPRLYIVTWWLKSLPLIGNGSIKKQAIARQPVAHTSRNNWGAVWNDIFYAFRTDAWSLGANETIMTRGPWIVVMRSCEPVAVQQGRAHRSKGTFTDGHVENLTFGAVIYRECRAWNSYNYLQLRFIIV
jgi:hypothetical protein